MFDSKEPLTKDSTVGGLAAVKAEMMTVSPGSTRQTHGVTVTDSVRRKIRIAALITSPSAVKREGGLLPHSHRT